MVSRYHQEARSTVGDIHVSVGVKCDACWCIERTWGDSGSAGCNGNLRGTCAVEGNLQDLVEVSVADIEIGAGIINGECLRVAYGGATQKHAGFVYRVEG